MINFLIVIGISFFNPPQDSIGIEIINGRKFVVHEVTQGETLYGISKRYGATIDQILEFNKSADAGLEIGQILKVPYTPRTATRFADGIIHKVAEKETLFSISRMYDVTVYEIREWNSLQDNKLSLGQELVIRKKAEAQQTVNGQSRGKRTVHIVAPKETLFSISRTYGVSVQQLRAWNNLSGTELEIGQSLFVAQPTYMPERPTERTTEVVTPPLEQQPEESEPKSSRVDSSKVKAFQPSSSTIVISETIRGSDEVVESGLAELIEGTDGSRKYLALHRTAPVGTILKVKNHMNNREVFVRVVGKLPDIAQTNRLIIKISKSAYDRLGAIDPRFRVEVTYYK